MDVAYCPECKKAGLRCKDDWGLDPLRRTRYQAFTDYQAGKDDPVCMSERYCPRCKKWVTPEYRNVMVK